MVVVVVVLPGGSLFFDAVVVLPGGLLFFDAVVLPGGSLFFAIHLFDELQHMRTRWVTGAPQVYVFRRQEHPGGWDSTLAGILYTQGSSGCMGYN